MPLRQDTSLVRWADSLQLTAALSSFTRKWCCISELSANRYVLPFNLESRHLATFRASMVFSRPSLALNAMRPHACVHITLKPLTRAAAVFFLLYYITCPKAAIQRKRKDDRASTLYPWYFRRIISSTALEFYISKITCAKVSRARARVYALKEANPMRIAGIT